MLGPKKWVQKIFLSPKHFELKSVVKKNWVQQNSGYKTRLISIVSRPIKIVFILMLYLC